MFFAKAIAWAANAMRGDDDEGPNTGMYYILQFVLQITDFLE